MSNGNKTFEGNEINSHKSHGCSCGCHGHDHSHNNLQEEQCGSGECGRQEQGPITLTRKEIEILLELKEYNYMPIAEFAMSSSENDHVSFTALAPVYIEKIDDSMEKVKELGEAFKALEKKRLISIDYDITLQGFDYSVYTESDLYKYFVETVEAGKEKTDFLCDTADIEFGSVALTDLGKKAVDSITVEK